MNNHMAIFLASKQVYLTVYSCFKKSVNLTCWYVLLKTADFPSLKFKLFELTFKPFGLKALLLRNRDVFKFNFRLLEQLIIMPSRLKKSKKSLRESLNLALIGLELKSLNFELEHNIYWWYLHEYCSVFPFWFKIQCVDSTKYCWNCQLPNCSNVICPL